MFRKTGALPLRGTKSHHELLYQLNFFFAVLCFLIKEEEGGGKKIVCLSCFCMFVLESLPGRIVRDRFCLKAFHTVAGITSSCRQPVVTSETVVTQAVPVKPLHL
jgi:hypothetical protein